MHSLERKFPIPPPTRAKPTPPTASPRAPAPAAPTAPTPVFAPPSAPPQSTLEKLPTMLTVPEAAKLLRLNRKTVYEAIQNGQLPGVRRFGTAIRLSRDALKDWIRAEDGAAAAAQGSTGRMTHGTGQR